jgi:hypothetical protein
LVAASRAIADLAIVDLTPASSLFPAPVLV